MNIRCRPLIISIVSLPIFLACPALVHSETSLKTLFSKGTSGPITITGSMEIQNKNNNIIMVWPDKVHATNDDITLDCNRLEIYYIETPKEDGAERKLADGYSFEKIDRVIITGDIKISRNDGSSASGEKVIYNKADKKVIMTGNPVLAKYDNNLIECMKITYDLEEEKYFFEGDDTNKPKGVISR